MRAHFQYSTVSYTAVNYSGVNSHRNSRNIIQTRQPLEIPIIIIVLKIQSIQLTDVAFAGEVDLHHHLQ